jgi:hypothetical protein
MEIPLVLGAVILSVILVYCMSQPSASKSTRVIPGPTPYPLVGHTFQVPTVKTWRYFEKLYHQYGGLQSHIILSFSPHLQDPS